MVAGSGRLARRARCTLFLSCCSHRARLRRPRLEDPVDSLEPHPALGGNRRALRQMRPMCYPRPCTSPPSISPDLQLVGATLYYGSVGFECSTQDFLREVQSPTATPPRAVSS
jgi:hypothetical protein